MQNDASNYSARTEADSEQKDQDISVSQHSIKPPVVGSQSRVVSLKKMSKIWLSQEYMDKRKQSYDKMFKTLVQGGPLP